MLKYVFILFQTRLLSALKELYSSVCMLARIASSIRALRLERGGLELESVEVSVQFENTESRTGKLEDIVPKEVRSTITSSHCRV